MEKTAKKLAKQVFHCVEAAASERQVQVAKTRWHSVTPTIAAQIVPIRTRDRQKVTVGTEPATITQYTVQWHWTVPTADRVQHERRSTFVLMSSAMTLDADTALREYKAQDQDEHGFRWMKSPIHLTAFFCEKPERVVGLGYVLLLALQIARFMRAVVRHVMVDHPSLELPDHRKIERPSETVI